jgi:hypothetical protein
VAIEVVIELILALLLAALATWQKVRTRRARALVTTLACASCEVAPKAAKVRWRIVLFVAMITSRIPLMEVARGVLARHVLLRLKSPTVEFEITRCC